MTIQISMIDGLAGPMVDINSPEKGVQIIVRGGRVWVNVDGVCRLRVTNSPHTELNRRFDLAAQVKTLGADSLLPPEKETKP